ncbi:MAG TPA: J domain-containing protein [Thermodesulfobacteriota bacterium]|nr:J domain-containing protein [Thermodesulfobacteriota bacterium]
MKQSYYDILNISPTCSSTELRRRWLDLMKVYHPDKFGDRGVDVTKKINEAYEVLSDPERRREYEEQYPHVMPVVLKEPTWRESASSKVAYLLNTVSHWKDFYNTAVKIIRSHKDSSVNMGQPPRQPWLGIMKRRTTMT